MLFPLGLGTWLPRIPIATLTLIVCISIYSIFQFPVLRAQERFILEGLSEKDIALQRMAAFGEFCVAKGQPPEVCDFALKGFASKKQKRNAKKTDQESPSAPPKEVGFGGLISRAESAYALIKDFGDADLSRFDTPSIVAYAATKRGLQERTAEYSRRNSLFSRVNLTPWTTLRHLFLHGDYMHLIGNMVLLLAFGIYVEALLGSAAFLAMFVGGGAFAGLVFLFSEPDPTMTLIGASGGVSAVFGAFFALFFRREMAFWFTFFFVYNRRVFVPVYYALPITYIANDLAGVTMDKSGNVAHMAHLAGFAIGALLGAFASRRCPADADVIYPEELALERASDQAPSAEIKSLLLEEVLHLNPGNLGAFEKLLSSASEASGERKAKLKSLVARSFARYSESLSPKRKAARLLELVRLVPFDYRLDELADHLSQKELLRMATSAEQRKLRFAALRVLEYYLDRFPNSSKAPAIAQAMSGLHVDLLRTASATAANQEVDSLLAYVSLHPESKISYLHKKFQTEVNHERTAT